MAIKNVGTIVNMLELIALAISLIVGGSTIVIGCATIGLGQKQNEMMKFQESFMKEQSRIAEINAETLAEKQASEYIRTHYADRDLIPLANIAEMYGSEQPFKRPLYGEFMMLSTDAQKKVFEKLKITKLDVDNKSFWKQISNSLKTNYDNQFPNDRPVFYESAKYLEGAFTDFGSKPIPEWEITLPENIVEIRSKSSHPMLKNKKTISSNPEYIVALTDVLSAAMRDEIDNPALLMFGNLIYEYGDIRSYYSECILAGYFAIYMGNKMENNDTHGDYGSPSGPNDERLETMEDVFLWTLFHIYTNLVMTPQESDPS